MSTPAPARIILILVLAALFAIGTAASIGLQTRSGDTVEITGEQDDMVFAAGGTVRLSLTTPDDVFAVGGDIEVVDTTADHLSLAGADIVVSGADLSDILAAGADLIFIDGTVTDDIIAAAADLTIRRDFAINGSAVVSGPDLTLDGPIGADLKAAGEHVRLNGSVGGSADVRATTLIIGETARINGDLRHRSQTLEIADGAVIEGTTVALEPVRGPHMEPLLRRAAVMFALFGILLVLGLIVLVLVAVTTLPGLMNRSRRMLVEQPLSTLGIGFLLTVAAPALIGLLFVSILGVPLAVLIGAIYVALAPLALAASIYTVAVRARSAFAGGTDAPPGLGSRLIWTGLVAIVFLLIGWVPIIGGVVWLLAFVFGLGAVASQAWLALSPDAPAPATV